MTENNYPNGQTKKRIQAKSKKKGESEKTAVRRVEATARKKRKGT